MVKIKLPDVVTLNHLQLSAQVISKYYRGYTVPVPLFSSFALTFLLQFNISFQLPSRYNAIEHAYLPAYSPHSHTQFPRTSFPIQLRHQVCLTDHTESPPPADSLLSPSCHPTQAQSSMIQLAQLLGIERSICTLLPFPVDIILRCAHALFLHTPKASFTSQGLFSMHKFDMIISTLLSFGPSKVQPPVGKDCWAEAGTKRYPFVSTAPWCSVNGER